MVFPNAKHVVADPLVLSEEERSDAEEQLKHPLRQKRFRTYVGLDAEGEVDGYAVIQSEIGKFKPFTFIVGMEPDGSVRRVAVLVYREARGGEIARRRYLSQYDGKTARDPLDKNRDIINRQGATMSVDAINYGVRKALSVVEVAYLRRSERLGSVRARAGTHLKNSQRDIPARSPILYELAAAQLHEVREARYLMGTVCEIRAFGPDAARLRTAIFDGFAEMEAAERALSDYRADSELSRLSRLGFREDVALSASTVEFLRVGESLWKASDGAFDLTVGPLVDAWGFRGAAVTPVPDSALADLLERVGQPKVRLRQGPLGQHWGRLDVEGMRLDPGALGKGFAVDRCVARLRDAGVTAALVEISSTAYALGSPPGATAWEIALRDPSDSGRSLGRVALRDEALAVSGSAEKFFELGGERHSHIIVPSTGRPVRGRRGAVVIADSATAADGWATAACVLGVRAQDYLQREPSVRAGYVLWEEVLWEEAGESRFAETPLWSRRLVGDLVYLERRSDG